QFDQNKVVDFQYNVSGINNFLPTITFTIRDNDLRFLSSRYPLDGETASIYIRSKADELKTIRNDFVITNITSTENKDGKGNIYTISGYLKVPKLYSEVCKAIRNKTSKD